jgi:hypothetical protein
VFGGDRGRDRAPKGRNETGTGGVATMSTTSGELVKEDQEWGGIMAKVIFGNHSSAQVPRQDRDNIRKFYCDVLGGKIMKVDPERFVRKALNHP